MFSSSTTTNAVNPFPHLMISSSSYNPSPNFIIDHHHHHHQESNGVFLHQPHNNPLAIPLLSPNINLPPISESLLNVAASNSAMMYSSNPPNFVPVKKPVKKDRHSKISTAQGVRDRRVRLSIEIARKFFDLQDMLGFDKASKTLDWLFSKSKKSIKKLEQEFQDRGSRGHEVVSETAGVSSKEKELEKAAVLVSNPAKESRAKARARARERTMVKMSSKGLHQPNTATHISNQNEYIYRTSTVWQTLGS